MRKILCTISTIVFCASLVSAQEAGSVSDVDKKKEARISKDQQAYQKMGGVIEEPEFKTKAEKQAYAASQEKSVEPKREISPLPEDPSFPKYVNTGNKEVDDANYAAAKDQWINSNRSKYNQMVKPEDAPLSQEERIKLDQQLKNQK